MDPAGLCRGVVCRGVPGMNTVIISAVPALCDNAPDCVPVHRITQFLAQSKNSDHELEQTRFPTKIAVLPWGRSSSGGGCSGWIANLPLRTVRALCSNAPQAQRVHH